MVNLLTDNKSSSSTAGFLGSFMRSHQQTVKLSLAQQITVYKQEATDLLAKVGPVLVHQSSKATSIAKK